MELNPQQKEAVYSNASKIVCLAGAGSGKTASLVSRIDRLVNEGVDPNSILVLTFTRAAAVEMRSRYLQSHMGQSIPEFRTFHSFCYSLIAKDSDVRAALGFDSVPAIADKADTRKIEQSAAIQIKTSLKGDQLQGKNLLTPKQEYEYKLYKKTIQRLMKAKCLITFDELSKQISTLFVQNDPCTLKYKHHYKHILVDEYQDTDDIQHMFVMSFQNSNIFTVGDLLQSIYSFRGADSSIMKSLVDDPEWQVVKLYHNYRSCQCICDYANRNTQYASPQYRLELQSNKPGGSVAICNQYNMQDWDEDPIDEDILSSIYDEMQAGLEGSTAILTRTNQESDFVRAYFRSKGVNVVKSKRDEEATYILKSVISNDYFLHWLTTFLTSSQYAQYLRLDATKCTSMDIEEFCELFSFNPHIKYRVDTVLQIRDCLRSNDSALAKCVDIFRLLDVKCDIVDTDAKTASEILKYIHDTIEAEAASDIYVGTIHSVKGLEYDNVFVVGVNDRRFKLVSEDNLNLFYVAITRAKYNLRVWKFE